MLVQFPNARPFVNGELSDEQESGHSGGAPMRGQRVVTGYHVN